MVESISDQKSPFIINFLWEPGLRKEGSTWRVQRQPENKAGRALSVLQILIHFIVVTSLRADSVLQQQSQIMVRCKGQVGSDRVWTWGESVGLVSEPLTTTLRKQQKSQMMWLSIKTAGISGKDYKWLCSELWLVTSKCIKVNYFPKFQW